MDLAVASWREDRLVTVVVPDDQQRLVAVASHLDDFAGALRHPDRSSVDRDAVAYVGSHRDHLLGLTIRRRADRCQGPSFGLELRAVVVAVFDADTAAAP